MKYQFFKRATKSYEEKFSRVKKTKEIRIDVDGIVISISEHQLGIPLNEPHVYISIPNGYSYSMDFNTFIKKLTN